MFNKVNNQRGIVLPIVIVLVAIISLLGFTALGVAENQTLMVSRHQQREKALHYAEAGIHRYLALLNEDFDYYTTPESNAMQNVDITFESGFYRLVITAPSVADPYVTIRSTGWANNSNVRRTVEVKTHKRQFVQYLSASNTGNDVFSYTKRYIRGDVINGPLHTNGDLIINGHVGAGPDGPVFNGPVTYAGLLIFELGEAGGSQQFNAGYPQKVDPLALPYNNESLEVLATQNGYIYTGRTCIYIDGSSLSIRNKDGAVESRSLPPNGVIYVKGTTGNRKWELNTGNVYVSGTLDGKLTIAAENDIYITSGNPTNWNKPGSTPAASGGVKYSDLNSAGPISSDNLEQAMAACDDMLGLVANRNVRILHKNWPKASDPLYWPVSDVAPNEITVHASICALSGSFEYEQHLEPPVKGNVNVIGSITQNKMGPVAGFALGALGIYENRLSGYGKNYFHDPRLMYELPPHFLEPVNNGWEIVGWREI